jgi:hypothetical protein
MVIPGGCIELVHRRLSPEQPVYVATSFSVGPRRAMWVKAAFMALARNLQVGIDERKQAA